MHIHNMCVCVCVCVCVYQVLFDLALNKCDYPDLTSRCQKKKAGLMSWFGRK